MQKILHFNVIGGIAGDMVVGGLLDLGVPFSVLEQGLAQFKTLHVHISHQKALRHHISGTHFLVENSDPLGTHSHRSYRNIKQLIEESSLPSNVKELSFKIFEQLANY